MFAAQVIYNVGDLILGELGLHESVVSIIGEFWPLLFVIAPISALILCTRILPDSERATSAFPRFWVYVGISSVAIHSLFCVQAYLPLKQGGMVSGGAWLLVFGPQYLLDFFLPPVDPLNGDHINYFHFWGKVLVAYPASLVYSLLLVGCGAEFWGIYQRLNRDHKP